MNIGDVGSIYRDYLETLLLNPLNRCYYIFIFRASYNVAPETHYVPTPVRVSAMSHCPHPYPCHTCWLGLTHSGVSGAEGWEESCGEGEREERGGQSPAPHHETACPACHTQITDITTSSPRLLPLSEINEQFKIWLIASGFVSRLRNVKFCQYKSFLRTIKQWTSKQRMTVSY